MLQSEGHNWLYIHTFGNDWNDGNYYIDWNFTFHFHSYQKWGGGGLMVREANLCPEGRCWYKPPAGKSNLSGKVKWTARPTHIPPLMALEQGSVELQIGTFQV